MGFGIKNYVVEHKQATPEQWRGEVAKSTRLYKHFGRIVAENETDAIDAAMNMIGNMWTHQHQKDLEGKRLFFLTATMTGA